MRVSCHSRESGNPAPRVGAAHELYDARPGYAKASPGLAPGPARLRSSVAGTRFWIPAFAGMTFIFLFLLSACAVAPERDHLTLTQVDFADLPGWNKDHQSEAVPVLLNSCVHRKTPACAALKQVPAKNDAAARAYFTRWFKAYAAAGDNGGEGLFTGYYEASLKGSRKKTKRFAVPLYAKPSDLVTADLGIFNPELKGHRLIGKVEKQKLVPYDSRGAIGGGGLRKRGHVLLWVDDPVDAFFLAVQGSGRVRMTDGSVVHVGYDDANGRTYVPIGRILQLMKKIDAPVTMEKIRIYLAQHPGDADEIMNLNASYVFFKIIKGPGPIGAEGVPLTPKRSLAVDPAFVKLGTPVWLDTEDAQGDPLRRLMVAQDTGGAIKGPVRGDFFWGYGSDAAAKAGAMQSRGHYYLLLPKDADVQ